MWGNCDVIFFVSDLCFFLENGFLYDGYLFEWECCFVFLLFVFFFMFVSVDKFKGEVENGELLLEWGLVWWSGVEKFFILVCVFIE